MRSRPALAAMVGVGAALMTAAPAAADNCLAFKAKVQNAHNGDVITLDEGLTCNDTYVLPSDRTAPFSITIQGAGTGATLDGTAQLTRIMTGEPTAGHQLNVTIRRLTFRNGTTASGSGGALELAGAHVSATLDRDRFLGNSAPAGLGGAAHVQSTASTRTIEVTDSRFGDGTAAGANSAAFGGALSLQSSGGGPSLTVLRNVFERNSSSQTSGAFEFVVNSADGAALIKDNGFRSNTANGSAGGAVSGGTNSIELRRNFFVDNTLAPSGNTGVGGALALSGDAHNTLTQRRNSFRRNRISRAGQTKFSAGGGAEWVDGYNLSSQTDRFGRSSLPSAVGGGTAEGGGLGVEGCPSPATPLTVRLVNDSIAGNVAGVGARGAGVYMGGCTGGPVRVSIFDSTIAGNKTSGAGATAGLAGGPDDKLTLRNSIVTGNPGGANLKGFGAGRTITFSDVCAPGVVPGAGNVCVNPRLQGPAQGNVHLLPTSPLIDAGRNAAIPAGIDVDFDAQPRIQLERVDIGADEYHDQFQGVFIPTQTVTVKNGVAKVQVSCPFWVRGPCAGEVKLRREGGKVVGHHTFSIGAGKTARVPVQLSSSALADLHQKGSLTVKAGGAATDGFGIERPNQGHKVTLEA